MVCEVQVAKTGDSARSLAPFFFHCDTIRAGCHQFKQVQDHTLKITRLISPFLARGGGRVGGLGGSNVLVTFFRGTVNW